MMSRDELQRHLHTMVNRLFDEIPEDWLDNGIYPMLRITFGNRDDDTPAFDLVVGLTPPSQD